MLTGEMSCFLEKDKGKAGACPFSMWSGSWAE